MHRIKIGSKYIGNNEPAFIIAEIGGNHCGNVDIAKKMIASAAGAGADAVKFQTYVPEEFVLRSSQEYEGLKSECLSFNDFQELMNYSKERNILFLSTPLDFHSIDALYEMGVPAFKIASCDVNNFPLIEKVARLKKPVLISTGAAYLNEIQEAISFIRKTGNEDIVVMHCCSLYPAPFSALNLSAITGLKEQHPDVIAGYSDHSTGIEIPAAAVALGAKVIEKHFTIDNSLPCGDNEISANTEIFSQMVRYIRNIEKAMGKPSKDMSEPELRNRGIIRRSLVARRNIRSGEKISEQAIAILRPGTGLEPGCYFKIIGKTASRDIKADEMISMDMIRDD